MCNKIGAFEPGLLNRSPSVAPGGKRLSRARARADGGRGKFENRRTQPNPRTIVMIIIIEIIIIQIIIIVRSLRFAFGVCVFYSRTSHFRLYVRVATGSSVAEHNIAAMSSLLIGWFAFRRRFRVRCENV